MGGEQSSQNQQANITQENIIRGFTPVLNWWKSIRYPVINEWYGYSYVIPAIKYRIVK